MQPALYPICQLSDPKRSMLSKPLIYDQENVTPSALEFRMAVAYPRGFMAGDSGATLRTWGLNNGDGCTQYIGSVPLSQGLSIAFPNIYQSRMRPGLRLLDPTREGKVTIVAFLLVDPEIRPILSTAVVPPQQESWVKEAVIDALKGRLPGELVEEVLEGLEGYMTEDEAENYRGLFADTLARFTEASNRYHFCIPFDVWNSPDSVQ